MTEDPLDQPPTTVVAGFKQQAFSLQISVGYMTFPHKGLMLFATEIWVGKEPAVWRRFWVTPESALQEAEQMCAEAAEYLDMVSTNWRPAEDLDFDDFLERLRLHVEGGMH